MKLVYRDKPDSLGDYELEGTALVDGVLKQVWKISPILLSDAKKILKDRVTNYRWLRETNGIVINGMAIKTGIEDQNRINSIISNMSKVGLTSIDFKAVNGWYTLSNHELDNVVIAIAKHIQQCFSAEKRNHEEIDKITSLADLEEYDIKKYFP